MVCRNRRLIQMNPNLLNKFRPFPSMDLSHDGDIEHSGVNNCQNEKFIMTTSLGPGNEPLENFFWKVPNGSRSNGSLMAHLQFRATYPPQLINPTLDHLALKYVNCNPAQVSTRSPSVPLANWRTTWRSRQRSACSWTTPNCDWTRSFWMNTRLATRMMC